MKITYTITALDPHMKLHECTEDYTHERIDKLSAVLKAFSDAELTIRIEISIHY